MLCSTTTSVMSGQPVGSYETCARQINSDCSLESSVVQVRQCVIVVISIYLLMGVLIVFPTGSTSHFLNCFVSQPSTEILFCREIV